MTKVKPKLYLNMSPETVEEGGLVFARNMKIDDDGHLTSDYGYKDLNLPQLSGKTIIGHIVGLDNKVYLFTKQGEYPSDVYNIFEYDEIKRTVRNTGVSEWSWRNGKISGYVSTNISGEKILTIAEYSSDYITDDELVPLKHINLSHYDVYDESVYTQAPICPTANLVLNDTYVKTIPNGVYVFFIRYKIRKDVYTDWFLCSRPIFGGTSEKITTLQGGLSYINLHKDSAKSFVFQLDFAAYDNIQSYSEFQLGFIITHDEATDARVWKHFDISSFTTGTPSSNQNLIYFDYDDVQETNIDDLLKTTYEIYNVGNVTSFKNKLYISNYIETDFNPYLQGLANKISLSQVHSGGTNVNYKNFKLNGEDLIYNDSKGYYDARADGYPMLDLLSYWYFNHDITKLAKTSSKQKQDIVKFDLIWSGRYDPDVAFIYNIYNYIYNKEIFGPNFAPSYEGITSDLGIVEAGSGNNLWVYQRSSTRHPWDDLGLTFAFGSFDQGDAGRDYARQGCSYFNKNSYGQWGISPNYGWVTRDVGFNDMAKAAMVTKLKEDIRNKSFWGKAYLEITSGANTYTIGYADRMDLDNYAGYSDDIEVISDSLFSTETISYTLQTKIWRWVYYAIFDSTIFKGFDESGVPVINLNGDDIRVSSVSVKFKRFDFELDELTGSDTDGQIYKQFAVSMTTTDYVSLCNFSIKPSLIQVDDTVSGLIQASTLMPLSTYQPYVHFVDNRNIITNGFPLSSFTTGPAQSDKDIITLKYAISNLPSNIYKSFFISLVNIGDIIMEGFDYNKDPNDNYTHIIHCLEIDTMLYNINDNITIINASGQTITTTAKYYSSGSNYPSLAFGNCGYVSWKDNTFSHANERLYIKVQRNKSSENINNLVKSSSYIPLANTSSRALPDGYYGSWLCLVKKPNFMLSSSCYVSGKDVYAVNRSASLSLTDFKNFIQVQDSVTYIVRSNFNLNYLSLTEDITDSIFSVGSASAGVKQVAKVINSAILSYIYELKPMYKDFSNKYFRKYATDANKTLFDNTIRVSNVLSDETFNNSVFKFEATNYYNVPTDRGVIVLLFSIGNNIFVHTKGSLYKFDANQTITASDSDISLQEAEPFDAGISQILDSQYGYGGIDNKEAGCITFDSYFFYDRFSTHIFAYGGNSQIQLIDASIYKLLKYYSPTYCSTLHDDVNHRVLFNFKNLVNNSLKNLFTISYNYKSRSFVAIHDIDLTNSFAGRTRVFSYKGGSLFELFDTDTPISEAIVPEAEGLNIYKLFGDASIASDLFIHDLQTSPFNIAVVMFPANTLREVINSMKFIGETITDYINTIENEDEENPLPSYDLIHIPKHNNVNPVKSLQIVTDTCVSNLISTTVDDTVRPDHTITDYKGFKHEIDSWNANYFRSIINSANIYNYNEDARELQPITPDLISDRNSLVYGKYYVLVFNFIKNVPIKFEEVFINSEKY